MAIFSPQIMLTMLRKLSSDELKTQLLALEPMLNDTEFRAFADAVKVGVERRYPKKVGV